MTPATSDPTPSSPVLPRRAPRWLLLVLPLAGAVLMGLVVWYLRRPHDHVEPPAIPAADADPEVRAAIEAARDEVRLVPDSATAWGQLAKVFAAHYYNDEAIVCYTHAEQLAPDDVRWPYLKGTLLLARNPDTAIVHFQRAVQLRGDLPILRLQLADALLGQERLDEAEQQYRRLLDLDPANPRARLGLGRLAYQRGDLPASRRYLDEITSSPFTRKTAHILLAEIEQRGNNAVAAARESYRAAEQPDDEAWHDPFQDEVEQLKTGKRARLKLALRLFEHQRPQEALALLHELDRDYPNWDQVWLAYGRILYETHQVDAAEKALRRTLELAPASVQAHFHLGLVLFDRPDYAAAAASFREAIRFKPDYARAYFNLGQALRLQGDKKAALDAFAQAVRHRPNYAAAYTNLGELLAERGDRVEALRHLQLALELNPDDATAKKVLEQVQRGG